jgi:uncharacterized membrane protein HdeD (DUF308 family)
MADTHLQRPASPMSALAWGALAIGGIFAIIIGLVAIIWPSVTFTVLVVLLGVYASSVASSPYSWVRFGHQVGVYGG